MHLTRSPDVVIVGGGIVGCATARQLKLQRPNLKVALLEKESILAAHQSGHNSGVLHAGIYYQPHSLKAKLCVEGIDSAYAYLEKKGIAHKRCGKLIVATEQEEIPRLMDLFKRATTNKCRGIELVDGDGIREIEPHCKGLKAIWSPYTGIVDYAEMTKSFASDFKERGGEVILNWKLKGISPSGRSITTTDKAILLQSMGGEDIHTNHLITCAGLHSDRVAGMSGCSPLPKIVPFRGEYLYLKKDKHYLASAAIYPVPDPRLPFLGVHVTPTIHGEVLLGPNALLAGGREGYKPFDISPRDLFEALTFGGLQKLVLENWRFGLKELYCGMFLSAQVRQLQRFLPDLDVKDVSRGRAGVRAQALDGEGKLVDDFVFDSGQGELSERVLHVRNAPSPGATSSMAIARMVVETALDKFKL